MKHRKERFEQRLAEELTLMLDGDLRDDRLDPVRITRVRCSNDLSVARVGITVEGNEARTKNAALAALTKATPAIRAMLGERLSGRFMPDFIYHVDDTEALLETIEGVRKELETRPPEEPEVEEEE